MVAAVGKRMNAQCRISVWHQILSTKPQLLINTDIVEKIYFRLCKTSYKKRYCNHTRSFRLQSYSDDTELSKYVCELKIENKIPFIKCIKGMLNQDLIFVSCT